MRVELEGRRFVADVVVVSPLTSEAILGLDFLRQQQASIDLGCQTLRLRESGYDIPLQSPTPLCACSVEQCVRVENTVEVPPRSMLDISAYLEATVDGVWLVDEATSKALQVAVARALVQPRSTTIPVRILNMSEDPHYAGTLVGGLQPVDYTQAEVGEVSGGEVSGGEVSGGEVSGGKVSGGKASGGEAAVGVGGGGAGSDHKVTTEIDTKKQRML